MPAPPSGSRLSLSTVAVIVGLVFAFWIAWIGLQIFVGRTVEKSLEARFENPGATRFDAAFADFDGVIDGAKDERELAVHEKCRDEAIRKLKALPENRRAAAIQSWATSGFSARLERVSDYVACAIATSPERFCNAGPRQRIATLVLGYFEIQRIEARIDAEDREVNPGKYNMYDLNDPQTTVEGLPARIFEEPDRRIMSGVGRLIDNGYVPVEAFTPPSSMAMPQALGDLLKHLKPIRNACES